MPKWLNTFITSASLNSTFLYPIVHNYLRKADLQYYPVRLKSRP